MIVLKLIAIVLLWMYAAVLLFAVLGFLRTRIFHSLPHHKNKTRVSIIVCARNEEKYIENCLSGIVTQIFDKNLLEIVFVNDASTDQTLLLAEKMLSVSGISYRIINNFEKKGKKQCLTDAIQICSGELIITRDADTFTLSNVWLKTIVDYHEITGKEFIIAPLQLENNNGLISQLQFFENTALSIITSGFTHFKNAFLCSGANLAYTKKLFLNCNGFSSHKEIASGDDVLLLEDVKKINPASVGYLKQNEASVITYPQQTWSALLSQKVRWAAKFSLNPNKTNTYLGILVFIIHFMSLFALIFPVFRHHFPFFGLIFLCCRLLIDYLLLFLGSRYFNTSVKYAWLLPVSIFYSFYVIVTGLASVIIKPNWK